MNCSRCKSEVSRNRVRVSRICTPRLPTPYLPNLPHKLRRIYTTIVCTLSRFYPTLLIKSKNYMDDRCNDSSLINWGQVDKWWRVAVNDRIYFLSRQLFAPIRNEAELKYLF